MAGHSRGLTWGLLTLRLGLGAFLVLCSLDKIISPETTVAAFLDYYSLIIAPWAVMIVGGAELALSLFFMLGMYKTWVYGAAFVIQGLALTMVLEKLIAPFGKDQIFFMLIPLLFAFGALFLMRNLDTKWTLTKKTSMFS